jgi:hypothetical protein
VVSVESFNVGSAVSGDVPDLESPDATALAQSMRVVVAKEDSSGTEELRDTQARRLRARRAVEDAATRGPIELLAFITSRSSLRR